jgi:hypothetical protein
MMMKGIDGRFRRARIWSNQELRKVAYHFGGDIVNVSAGDNLDKEGSSYDSYFPIMTSYWLTNYAPGSYRGYQGRDNEILLDLTKDIPDELNSRFDVVFNHTTLEHIFEINKAFENLCKLSRDIVVVVVPFAQVQHENDGYQDFWRFTPTCLRRLFEQNGFHVIYEACNDDFNVAVYLFFVASRTPDSWKTKMPPSQPLLTAGRWIGKSQKEKRIIDKFTSRILGIGRILTRK